MSGVLIIGPEDEARITEALAAARALPKPWAVFKDIVEKDSRAKLLLTDRKAGIEEVLVRYPSQQLQLGTYRVALSFEEQPAGIFKHLSVSSERKGKVPGPEVMQMVLEAFGFSKPICDAMGGGRALLFPEDVPFRAWVEEFEPGHMAINVIELENVTQ